MRSIFTIALALIATFTSVAAAKETDPSAQSSEAPSSKMQPSKELSVPPISHVTYPKNRPQWIVDEVDLTGSIHDPGTKHKLVVTSSPSDTAQEADDDCRLLAKAALLAYCNGALEIDTQELNLASDVAIEELISRKYEGTVSQGDTELCESAWELTIDDATRKKLLHVSKNVEVRNRLAILGIGVFGGFLLLLGSGGALGFISRRVEKTM
jgi:hypothetical protein